MMTSRFMAPVSVVYILLMLLTGWVVFGVGCGGSNPVVGEATKTEEKTPALNVEIEVSDATVKSGAEVRLTAKITSQPPGTERLLFLWEIVGGGGSFSNPPDQSSVVWRAPTVNRGKMQYLSVIRVTVTFVSQQYISNSSEGVEIKESITSATKVIPITVIGDYTGSISQT